MKKLCLILCTLCLILSLSACGRKMPEPAPTGAVPHNPTFTGILEDKKDFAITVTDDQGNAYLFNLGDLPCKAEVGDRITVTYNGDLTDFDSRLLAIRIVKN